MRCRLRLRKRWRENLRPAEEIASLALNLAPRLI